MRKVLSIFLLLVLLFNMVGYRAWFYYAEKQSDAAMDARLDKNDYNENELVSITIPLNNPYQITQGSFERVIGEMNFLGKNYRFVKRKVSNGNLVLLCLPDANKMVLKKAKTEMANAGNEMAGNNKDTRSGTQKSFNGSDYICQHSDLHLGSSENIIRIFKTNLLISLTDPFVVSPGKPPQSFA